MDKINDDIALQYSHVYNFQILTSDYLPTNVCFKCISEIQNWTKFKTLCDQSQKMLLKTIKTETAENTVALPAASSCIKTIVSFFFVGILNCHYLFILHLIFNF